MPLGKTREARFQFGLHRCAIDLRGGMRTMMHLAWLSGDSRARSVAKAWKALSPKGKRDVILEEICEAEGIPAQDFIGAVAGTGFQFRIDTAGIFAGIRQGVDAVARLSAEAMTHGGTAAAEQFLDVVNLLGPRW